MFQNRKTIFMLYATLVLSQLWVWFTRYDPCCWFVLKPGFHVTVPIVLIAFHKMSKRSGRSYGNAIQTNVIGIAWIEQGSIRTIRSIVKNLKRSNGNTRDDGDDQGDSKSIPKSIVLSHNSLLFSVFQNVAISCEMNSSLLMKEVKCQMFSVLTPYC